MRREDGYGRSYAVFDPELDRHVAASELNSPRVTDIVGRWARDRVALIGDYDESKLRHEKTYHNISRELVKVGTTSSRSTA